MLRRSPLARAMLAPVALAGCVALAACGASQKPPSNTGANPPRADATPTPTPTPDPGKPDPGKPDPAKPDPGKPTPAAPLATEAQCTQAIDHILSLILASPEVPESAKAEWPEKEPAVREKMLRDCVRELTVTQYQCIMSKQTYPTLAECK